MLQVLPLFLEKIRSNLIAAHSPFEKTLHIFDLMFWKYLVYGKKKVFRFIFRTVLIYNALGLLPKNIFRLTTHSTTVQ